MSEKGHSMEEVLLGRFSGILEGCEKGSATPPMRLIEGRGKPGVTEGEGTPTAAQGAEKG